MVLEYSAHALDEMKKDSINQNMVEDTLKKGEKLEEKREGISVFYKHDTHISVVVDNQTQRIISVYKMKRKNITEIEMKSPIILDNCLLMYIMMRKFRVLRGAAYKEMEINNELQYD